MSLRYPLGTEGVNVHSAKRPSTNPEPESVTLCQPWTPCLLALPLVVARDRGSLPNRVEVAVGVFWFVLVRSRGDKGTYGTVGTRLRQFRTRFLKANLFF